MSNIASFPDWKRIGRRIGKKLRDVLDPRPKVPGPSAEERRVKRLRDALVGLVYFDTFEEVGSWRSGAVDPIQQANQPLLQRAANLDEKEGEKTKLLLCHDYDGGYHEHESVRPPRLEFEQYSCRYFQYVDTFVYFSHKLACVPPPSWINVAHRHGVKVLGTFLIEPQTANAEQMFMKTDGVFTIAKKLAAMADAYGFDGWLLNIEQDAPITYHDWFQNMIDFLNEIRKAMAKGKKVLWYDSVTTEGDVYYQNGLTSMNDSFVLASDGLFTNYKWTEKDIASSRPLAKEKGVPTEDIFFGVDVWAQNTNMSGSPRVTYPPDGGGGTNTGLAMSVLASNGFSTAMFAPAWAYEHFTISGSPDIGSGKEPSIANQVDESLWTGKSLPDDLYCDCRKGRPHHTDYYKNHPIVKYAHEYPAGSSSFFETRFAKAFQPYIGNGSDKPHKVQYWPALGSQDSLPHLIPMPAREWEMVNQGPITRVIYGELSADLSSSLRIFTKLAGCYEEADYEVSRLNDTTRRTQPIALRLYIYNMPANGSLEAIVEVQGKMYAEGISSGIYFSYKDRSTGAVTDIKWELHPDEELSRRIPIQHDNGVLVGFGVYMAGEYRESSPVLLMELTRIVIKPQQVAVPACVIRNAHIKEVSAGSYVQKRIVWSWALTLPHEKPAYSDGMPWSWTTGPFSSFTVYIDGELVGEACCLEFPLKNEDIEGLNDEAAIQIVGHIFGSGEVRSLSSTFPKSDLLVNKD